jgi:hypothetical protein
VEVSAKECNPGLYREHIADFALGRTYIIFAVLNAALVPTVYFLFPEPKGRSLEEMDVIFASAWADGVSPVKRAQTMPKLTGTEVETELAKYFGEDEAQVRRRSSVAQ